jgi:large subunit ribosomal protein L7e
LNRVIPENVQKKTARDAKVLKEYKEQRDKSKVERLEKRKVATANSEKWANEYATNQKAVIDARRKSKADGNIFVEAEPKIVFVIRTRG